MVPNFVQRVVLAGTGGKQAILKRADHRIIQRIEFVSHNGNTSFPQLRAPGEYHECAERCNYRLVVALALVAGLNPAARAQFEVATIKPHNPDIPGFGIAIMGRRLTAVNVSVNSLMGFAYTLHPRQIVDAPGWNSRLSSSCLQKPARNSPISPVTRTAKALSASTLSGPWRCATPRWPISPAGFSDT
jgi:hypothetical protein